MMSHPHATMGGPGAASTAPALAEPYEGGLDVTDANGTEQWRWVPGYEGSYEVSDQGRVRSWQVARNRPGPRILKPGINGNGYSHVTPRRGGVQRTLKVHVLVLTAFRGPRPDGMVARHLNGDKRDNRLANLAYGTPSENNRDAVVHGANPCSRRTHCPQGHPYSDDNTSQWKGTRKCRICHKLRERARRARKAT